MSSIRQQLGEKSRSDRYIEQRKKGTSQKELRDMEEKLMVPEELPEYTGPQPQHLSELDARTVLVVFKQDSHMELMREHFKLSSSPNVQTSLLDNHLLVLLLQALEEEAIEYDKEKQIIRLSKGTVRLPEARRRNR